MDATEVTLSTSEFIISNCRTFVRRLQRGDNSVYNTNIADPTSVSYLSKREEEESRVCEDPSGRKLVIAEHIGSTN